MHIPKYLLSVKNTRTFKLLQSELFTLVTDQGFLSKPNIVWETLSSVQGDSHFTDGSFRTTPHEPIDQCMSQDQQIDQVNI